MKNVVWSTVVSAVTAVRKPLRMWVLRPIVTVVAAVAIALVTAVYSVVTGVPEIWNSETWTE